MPIRLRASAWLRSIRPSISGSIRLCVISCCCSTARPRPPEAAQLARRVRARLPTATGATDPCMPVPCRIALPVLRPLAGTEHGLVPWHAERLGDGNLQDPYDGRVLRVVAGLQAP